MGKIYKYIVIFFIAFSVTAQAAESPNAFLKRTVDEVTIFIEKNRAMLENDEAYLKEKVNELIMPKFDINLMSKIVLGKRNWQAATNKKKEEFQDTFKDLLIKTYMRSLLEYDGDKIEFLPYISGKRPNVAKVKSVYAMSGGDSMPVDYRLKLDSKNEWKVFDIIFDGVSLLRNYRADFQEHIKKEGLDSLIAALREKS
ncbi:MAG: ABC transporter substrate-binding protein [Pseudomonadota bacterium]|nr:ABC transporter substrate-binding protein [Pseudomonadota bacterium]